MSPFRPRVRRLPQPKPPSAGPAPHVPRRWDGRSHQAAAGRPASSLARTPALGTAPGGDRVARLLRNSWTRADHQLGERAPGTAHARRGAPPRLHRRSPRPTRAAHSSFEYASTSSECPTRASRRPHRGRVPTPRPSAALRAGGPQRRWRWRPSAALAPAALSGAGAGSPQRRWRSGADRARQRRSAALTLCRAARDGA